MEKQTVRINQKSAKQVRMKAKLERVESLANFKAQRALDRQKAKEEKALRIKMKNNENKVKVS